MCTLQNQSMDDVVTSIQQRWGVKALRRLERVTATTTGIPTGCVALDRLLGVGGVPRGAMTCFVGRATSGKTTLALDMLAQVQDGGEVTLYIDLSGSLDPEYAEARGVDLDRLLMVWPQPPVLGLEITRDAITSGGAGLVVVDAGGCSVASGPVGAVTRTLRLLSVGVRKSPYALVCLVSPDTGGLGTALVAQADILVRTEQQGWLWEAAGVSGCEVRLTILKNRFASPGRTAVIPIRLKEPAP